MRKVSFNLLILLLLSACAITPTQKIANVDGTLDQAEQGATPEGRDILVSSRTLIENNEIIKGSCWDFTNAVFNQAHYPNQKRLTIFKSKMKGPFVDEKLIEAGDWLYYINHSYKKIDHSGIFVSWTNFDKKIGLIASYIGGNKKRPARYQNYDLSNVYHIIRARP
jgi:hypothetical protein